MSKLRLPRGQRADLLLAAIVAVVVTGSTAIHAGGFHPSDTRAYVIALIGAAALAVRHRFPLLAVTVAGVSTAYYYVHPFPDGPEMLTFALASYLAVANGQRLAAYLGTAAGLGVFAWAEFLVGPPQVGRFLGVLAWALFVLSMGEVFRYHRAYVGEARRRATEVERTHEEEVRRRATEERLRIARELHDVLAHNISLINVQAGAALHRRDPEQAYAALGAIKTASKETLRQLRTTLGVLRQVDEAEPLNPVPSLENLDELIAQTKDAGLPVELITTGPQAPLPAPVNLAAYRIVQEALTNAVRHAGSATVIVLVRYDSEQVTIKISDDGVGTKAPEGNGIRGMRERASTLGGALTAEPRDGGGFVVRATLPLCPSQDISA